jgi:hypothetical protein
MAGRQRALITNGGALSHLPAGRARRTAPNGLSSGRTSHEAPAKRRISTCFAVMIHATKSRLVREGGKP